MKKRNKKYKPKTIVQNPINYFIGGYKRIQGEELTDLYAKKPHGDGEIVQRSGRS